MVLAHEEDQPDHQKDGDQNNDYPVIAGPENRQLHVHPVKTSQNGRDGQNDGPDRQELHGVVQVVVHHVVGSR